MSVKPHRDRRVTTLCGALRQLSRHCGIAINEVRRALDENDAKWLATEFRSHAIQILMDIEVLATLAAEEPDPPEAVCGVMRAGVEFMVSLCEMAGLPDMKRELLKTRADCPISV